ncbi:MAG: hypothetical protein BWY41_00129 [Candidatus Atribacteria bacterium ADurb.Bin276]|uniref:DUF669 domain-containing protein n=1 Tax=Candidatus Atribacter allofermentans TaxID=1852833 RepID=A0A1V5T3W0_9BACT|nr:MAG: hypothetical protein BWY41_00129 [Candidatus Atribacteria bacterium ADurb.Bin276]
MAVIFSDQEEQAFKEASSSYLPDGDYRGILVEAEAKLIGMNRDKKLVLKYQLEAPEEHAGKTHVHFLNLENASQKAYGYLKGVVGKFGLPTDGLRLRDLESEMKKLCESKTEVLFSLIPKEYNGKSYQNTEIRAVSREESFGHISDAFVSGQGEDDIGF